jgi:hypothetical protein
MRPIDTSAATTGREKNSQVRLQTEIEELLRRIGGIQFVKKLFWELLGYDRRDENISLSGMKPDLRSHVTEAKLFASHDQFHVYYLTLTSDCMTNEAPPQTDEM